LVFYKTSITKMHGTMNIKSPIYCTNVNAALHSCQ